MQTLNIFIDTPDDNRYKWQHLPYPVRQQYNFLLNTVVSLDLDFYTQAKISPNYYNNNYCLALGDFRKATVAPPVAKAAKEGLAAERSFIHLPPHGCNTPDTDNYYSQFQECRPLFKYNRKRYASSPTIEMTDSNGNKNEFTLGFDMTLTGLSVGAVMWLYFYERMGIFKILGALMDDYNYRGKYTISSAVNTSGQFANTYTNLMEHISLLYRMGLASNLRDRVCLYSRVLGVDLDNAMDVKCERNVGFMDTYNNLINNMLPYYNARQLAEAIGRVQPGSAVNGVSQIRSSVATQTSIRDTIQVLQQQFEPMEYGRNQINTFFGIATVYTTLCLLRLLKNEIGIPHQYDKPEEFVPAAYDLLVLNRPVTNTKSNRFIIYDNCASYGYRLLTDLELVNLDNFTTHAQSSPLDQWLDDVEGLVEGYRNAYAAVPEKAVEMV